MEPRAHSALIYIENAREGVNLVENRIPSLQISQPSPAIELKDCIFSGLSRPSKLFHGYVLEECSPVVSVASRMDRPLAVATPHVGFFWFVRDIGAWHLVADRIPLAGAEPYGDCRTHPGGHYELWTELACKGHSWLKTQGFPTLIASSEYEAHPRGRVVYDTVSEGFVIYLDPRISAPRFRACLKAAFGLGGQKLIFRRDAHYRP